MEYDETRRAPRRTLEVDVVVTDMQSGIQIRERTKDPNLYGCGVRAPEPFASGTRVILNLTYEREKITAAGRVIYGNPDLGMGVAFTAIEPEDQRMLARWISELAGQE